MDALLSALKAAAEPTRLRLLALLAASELTVSDLTNILGQSQPRISRHLKLMCEAGLLDRFREGTWAFFRLATQGDAARVAAMLVRTLPDDDPVLALDQERLEDIQQARADRAAAYFRRNAADWHRIRSLHVPETDVEDALMALLPEGDLGSVLDIGTGTGRMLELLAPRAERAIGVDLSRDMLTVARANLVRARLTHASVRQADMYQIPLAGDSFDLVVIHQVLHYAERPISAVTEAARLTRPGGRLMVIDFAQHSVESLRDDHAHRRLGFADDDVAGWFTSAGLVTETPVRLIGDPLTVMIWPARRPTSLEGLVPQTQSDPLDFSVTGATQ